MASAIMTDCSSVHGSITSSSSDALTLTTASSSWCAIPICSRIRYVRLVRPHTRRILIVPGATPSFGFAVRGGKEYGTGFFVSNVDRNSEAQQKGLRIGDQILSINGFNVDDAIHKEFIQLVNKQERLTLKVRSVGMLPVKDENNGGFFWSAAHNGSVSNTPSESSYQSTSTIRERQNVKERDVNIILNVAPRTKLGLGICKGPEWKPGIFVQFTKERSVAREAGLRPGDQILSVNSIDFADVLFSEAVAVMKSTNKLDIMIRKGVGCDLFPTESSGYNSSASSVTGDQSPCWADVKSKRLTSVCEENSAVAPFKHNGYLNQTGNNKQDQFNGEASSSNSESNCKIINKEINKTIIKLSETGSSINNTANTNSCTSASATLQHNTNTTQISKRENLREPLVSSRSRSIVGPPPPPPPPPPALPMPSNATMDSIQSECKPPSLYNDSFCNGLKHENTRNCGNGNGLKLGGIAATMQRYQNIHNAKVNGTLPSNSRQGTTKFDHSLIKQEPDALTSLSNAITEELKKRKTKQDNQPVIVSGNASLKQTTNRPAINVQHAESTYCTSTQHDNFMSEFKEAHKRMFKNGIKTSEFKETIKSEVNPNLQQSKHNSSGSTYTEQTRRDESAIIKEVTALKPTSEVSSNYGCIQLRNKTQQNLNGNSNTMTSNKQSIRLPVETTNRSINTTLSNELQSTLSRLKLKKTPNSRIEHYQNHYGNQETTTDNTFSNNMRKQQSQIYSHPSNTDNSSKSKVQSIAGPGIGTGNTHSSIGVSILKNGSRFNANPSIKSTEKSIKFG